MKQPDRYILIWASDILTPWPEALCADPATATYYLAQEAARQGCPLRHDEKADFYHIGKNQYALIPLPLLNLDNVNRLRRRHEPPHR